MRRRAASNSAARCGRPEVLSAAVERRLLSLWFAGRVCVAAQNGRVLRQEISEESILAGTTVVACRADEEGKAKS